MAPLANFCLKNVVQVYEIFELEMFNLNKNLFNDKYKHDLDIESQAEFQEFIKQCDGVKLPSKLEVYNALKKLSMRALLADLDETQEMVVYLSERVDIWPKDNFEDKLDYLEVAFPKKIKLMHTLGNMFNSLGLEANPNHADFKNIKNKEEIAIKKEPIGRAINQSNQVKQKLKNLKKNERI